jgi:two-component system chemotaxis response regulator CheY
LTPAKINQNLARLASPVTTGQTIGATSSEMGSSPGIEPPLILTRRAVLLVEDDDDAREMTALALTAAGCEVWAAADGEAGLELAAAHRVDLIITDIAMPRMDGIQMVQLLRQSPSTKETPVIAVTGQAVADVPAQAQAAGCTTVLSKPCSPDDLIAVINQHIGRRRDDGLLTPQPIAYHGRERRSQ